MTLPTIFDCCEPRREVLAGELPDAIFAADLWDVIRGRAHQDYQDPLQFFAGTHPTENLKRTHRLRSRGPAWARACGPSLEL
jgi:hypothetical protein